MKPIERILAAIDFSESSGAVLQAAGYLADKVKGRLTVLHVVNQAPFDGHFFGPAGLNLVNQMESKAYSELQSEVASLTSHPLETLIEVKVGVPYVDLVRFSKQQKVQFLVAGTHGRSGLNRLLLGSVAETLIRKSECPVWIVKGSFKPPQKILILTDLSETSRAGFGLGLFLAKLFGASVHLVYVYEFPYIPSFAAIDTTEFELKIKETSREEFQKWVEEARISKIEVSSEFTEGSPADKIEEVVKKEKVDLLVMSTHGQSTLFHKELGAVATHLVRRVPCSIVTVRPEGFRLKEI